jgi:predicted RNA-binding Zn ribbon-like protein
VARFLAVRDPVLRVLRAGATNSAAPPDDAEAWSAPAARNLPPADVDAVNQLAAAAPAIRLLGARPGRYRTQPVTAADPATRLCAELAAAAIGLLTGPDAAALALCDAPGCGQLYLRGRPNQQWCDPHCGSRARAQRHADRAQPS